eukprot:3625962-Pleurochrysis_carterae.AAC.1
MKQALSPRTRRRRTASGDQSLARIPDCLLPRAPLFDRVYTQAVPQTGTWHRCRSDAAGACKQVRLIAPRNAYLHAIGIGGTPATPHGAITAAVAVMHRLADISAQCASLRGKIVDAIPFTNYCTRSSLRGAVPMAAWWLSRCHGNNLMRAQVCFLKQEDRATGVM